MGRSHDNDDSASDLRRAVVADAATMADASGSQMMIAATHAPGASGGGEPDLEPGTRVGEYEVEAVIGRGGFGTVYRALQPLIGKRVAIKVLSRKYSADEDMVRRFVAEARAVNQIRHRHIIDIFSFSQLPDGRHYYIMEHLDGVPLDRYIAERGPLKIDEALPILRAIARALDAAHAKGIAHRDLKPENIFIARDTDGELDPKLLDFGIAKLLGSDDALAHNTGTGVPIGTPFYMSPEQCRGRDVDHRTDIYSFGVLTYRLLTGTYPFDGDVIDILHKQMHDPPERPSQRNIALGEEADRAVLWMMAKDPAARPKTVIAAVVALQDDRSPTPMLSSATVSQVAAPLSADAPRAVAPRRRWIVPILGVAALAAVASVYVITRGTEPAPPPAARVAIPGGVLIDAAAAAPAVAVDAAVPAASKLVTIEVRGAPPRTEVTLAGTTVGVTPTPFQLARQDTPVTLVFVAEGYQLKTIPVTPDRDRVVEVTLVKKKKPTTAKPETSTGDELADPFKK